MEMGLIIGLVIMKYILGSGMEGCLTVLEYTLAVIITIDTKECFQTV